MDPIVLSMPLFDKLFKFWLNSDLREFNLISKSYLTKLMLYSTFYNGFVGFKVLFFLISGEADYKFGHISSKLC